MQWVLAADQEYCSETCRAWNSSSTCVSGFPPVTTEEKMQQAVASARTPSSYTGPCRTISSHTATPGTPTYPPSTDSYHECYTQGPSATKTDCDTDPSSYLQRNLCPCSVGSAHSSCAGTSYPDTCTVACDMGWNANMSQYRELKCLANGKFNASDLKLDCTDAKVMCPPVEFTNSTGSDRPFPFGESRTVKCDLGYTGADVKATCWATAEGTRYTEYEYDNNKPSRTKPENQCAACSPGTYKEQRGSSRCTPCGAGRRNPKSASKLQAECLSCEAGQSSNIATNSNKNCTKCPENHYQSQTNQSSCKKCPDHSSTAGTGMTMRDDCLCEAGYWAKRGDKECTECASGRYKERDREAG